MPPDTRSARLRLDSATSRVFALAELWALIAKHGDSVVGAWRLMRVCRAARLGAVEWLEALPGVVVCGGYTTQGRVREVWRLNLSTMRWESMSDLLEDRDMHACCTVRGGIVVLSGRFLSSVEAQQLRVGEEGEHGGAFVNLPPLSSGVNFSASGFPMDESDSAAGQVLLIGGGGTGGVRADVQLVDLDTGICTLQPNSMLHRRYSFASGQLDDGRVVCAGGLPYTSRMSAEVYGPPVLGAPDAPWAWTALPPMSVGRYDCSGCVLNDGRFVVLGGINVVGPISSCVVLDLIDAAGVATHWVPFPAMHEGRVYFACAALAGSIIVAGGLGTKTAEVYDEVLGRWFRLPRGLPHPGTSLTYTGCALL